MKNTWKKYSTALVIGETPIKTVVRYPLECLKLKRLTPPILGEDVEQPEMSYFVVGNTKRQNRFHGKCWYCHINQIPSLQPNNSIPRNLSEEKNICLQIGFCKNSHNGFIQKRAKLETITSINMNMNKPWDTTQLWKRNYRCMRQHGCASKTCQVKGARRKRAHTAFYMKLYSGEKNHDSVCLCGSRSWLGRRMRELSGADGDVLYLDRGLGHAGVCICQNSVNMHLRYMYFLSFLFHQKKKLWTQWSFS